VGWGAPPRSKSAGPSFPPMPTPTQTHQQTTHDMKSTEGPVPLTPPTQKSAVLCTQPPAGENHTKKAGDARQPKRLQSQHTHPSATRHPRLPTPPHNTLTCCAPHVHPLLTTAMAFVPYGFVLVQVQVQVGRRGCRVALGCVCVVFEAFWAVWRRQLSLCGAPPQGVVCKAPHISEWVV